MKIHLVAATAAFCLTLPSHAVLLAGWTFETSVPTTAGPHTAENGVVTSTAIGFHTSTSAYSNPAGNGSAESFSSNTWTTVGDYYQFTTSTLGYESITISFDQTRSSTGPSAFNFQYSTDGLSFTTFASYTVNTVSWSTGTPAAGSSFAYDLSSVSALNNAATVYFRLTSTATVVNTGTNRVDNFQINAVPEPAAALLGAIGILGFLRRRR